MVYRQPFECKCLTLGYCGDGTVHIVLSYLPFLTTSWWICEDFWHQGYSSSCCPALDPAAVHGVGQVVTWRRWRVLAHPTNPTRCNSEWQNSMVLSVLARVGDGCVVLRWVFKAQVSLSYRKLGFLTIVINYFGLRQCCWRGACPDLVVSMWSIDKLIWAKTLIKDFPTSSREHEFYEVVHSRWMTHPSLRKWKLDLGGQLVIFPLDQD